MASYYVLSFIVLITHNMVMNCASAAVHGHSVDAGERAADGAYRPRDAGHYSDGVHHSEFDHEAILGACFVYLFSSRAGRRASLDAGRRPRAL